MFLCSHFPLAPYLPTRKHESRIKGDEVEGEAPIRWMRLDCLCREQLREELMQQQKKSMQKQIISISNRSCLIHWPTELLEGSQFVRAASAQQHLLMMQHPTVSQPPCTGCEVVDACYMIWSMLSKREQGECLGYGAQTQRERGGENKKSAGVRCRIPATVEPVNTWPGSHTLSGSLPGLLFYLRTEEDKVSSLPVCLCRSWLQMCLCRGSLDPRRAVVGLLVRSAPGVASCWTLRAVACLHLVSKSPLYTSLSGMTRTTCQILVCGRFCPTLICHISSVGPACADPRGKIWSFWTFEAENLLYWRSFLTKKLIFLQKKCSFQDTDLQEGCFSLYLQFVSGAVLWGQHE